MPLAESDLLMNPPLFEGAGHCPLCHCKDVYLNNDGSVTCIKCGLVYNEMYLSKHKFDYESLRDQSEKLI